MERIAKKSDRQRLEEARHRAEGTRKKPFDFERLQELYDVAGPYAHKENIDLEEVRKRIEYDYYVFWPELMSMEDLARRLAEMDVYR